MIPEFNVGLPGKGGRRKKGNIKDAVTKAHALGMSVPQLEAETGISKDTIYSCAKRLGIRLRRVYKKGGQS